MVGGRTATERWGRGSNDRDGGTERRIDGGTERGRETSDRGGVRERKEVRGRG